jgi:prepilin signal peptidase PulO-like enzyme (type II secretory pathway)
MVEGVTGLLFAAVVLVAGPHWAVPGICALGATVLVLTLVEMDGMPSPPAVALAGAALGVPLLLAAAAADRRWWRLGGVMIGIAAAAAVAGLTARARGPVRSNTDRPWVLVPAGALLGWLGPVGGGIGAAVIAGIVVARYRAAKKHATASSGGETTGKAATGLLQALGNVGVAGAALGGAVASMAAAVLAGYAPGV